MEPDLREYFENKALILGERSRQLSELSEELKYIVEKAEELKEKPPEAFTEEDLVWVRRYDRAREMIEEVNRSGRGELDPLPTLDLETYDYPT